MIRVTVKGKDGTIKKLVNLPPRLVLLLTKTTLQGALLFAGLMKKKAPVGITGALQTRIFHKVKKETNQIIGEAGSNLRYARPIEFGLPMGKMPNIENIKDWARKVLGDENAAFAVARKIKEEGPEEQPFMRPTLKEGLPRVQMLFQSRLSQFLKEADT